MTHLFGACSQADSCGIDHLIDGLLGAVAGRESDLRQFETAVLATSDQGPDPARWYDLLRLADTEVQRHSLSNAEAARRCERLLLEARLLVSDAVARTLWIEQMHTSQDAFALRLLATALVCAPDTAALSRMVVAALPAVGIRFCCLCLFEDDSPPHARARVIASYEPATVPVGGLLPDVGSWWQTAGLPHRPSSLPWSPDAAWPAVFSTEHLLPADLDVWDEPRSLAVLPVTFARNPLGYVVFDLPAQTGRPWNLEQVVGHLSCAVYVIRQADSLRKARHAAEAASAAKSDFVANMSHELRTPLAAVIGYLDLCHRTELSPQQRRYLTQAQASSQALLGVLNDILDFSKIEARKLDIEIARFELDEVLGQIASTCGLAAARKGVELVIDVADDVPDILLGDPLRLGQILLNLVGNAVKFTERGEVVLEVRSGEITDEATTLCFSVRDTGIGIQPEQLERLAQPFSQADSSTTRRYGGTGLGLAISDRLIRRLGGELRVRSEVGRGSEFAFSVVLPGTCARRPSRHPDELRDLRVLVVDDNATSLRVTRRMLMAHGMLVCTAGTGQDALDTMVQAAVAGDPFDVVLMDHDLPGLDGRQTARQAAALLGPDAPWVLLTVPPGDPDCFTDQGALRGMLCKPVQRTELLRRIRGVLQGSGRRSRPPTSAPAGPAVTLTFPGKRVLLVEDNDVNRDVARELLELAGLTVHVAANGQEATESVDQTDYDAVLMDLHMPVMDGCEATRAIRSDARHASLPIIAMTASALAEDRQRCLEAGMNGHIRMPMDPAQLFGVLATWLPPGASSDQDDGNGPTSQRLALAVQSRALAQSNEDAPPSAAVRTLDSAAAIARLGGNTVLYRRLLRRFLESQQDAGQQIHAALGRGDVGPAVARVHALCGTAGNIGANEVHRAAQGLETALRSGNPPSPSLAAELEDALARALPVIAATARHSSGPPRSVSPVAGEGLRRSLERLARLLAQFDTAAVDCVDSLRLLVEPGELHQEWERLGRSVRAYDFERAAAELETLLGRLGTGHPSHGPS
jgi:signal transduction histidine kinase/CheY-like chemotaxis protein